MDDIAMDQWRKIAQNQARLAAGMALNELAAGNPIVNRYELFGLLHNRLQALEDASADPKVARTERIDMTIEMASLLMQWAAQLHAKEYGGDGHPDAFYSEDLPRSRRVEDDD